MERIQRKARIYENYPGWSWLNFKKHMSFLYLQYSLATCAYVFEPLEKLIIQLIFTPFAIGFLFYMIYILFSFFVSILQLFPVQTYTNFIFDN